MIIINIACLSVVCLMARTLKREREQHKNEIKKLQKVQVKNYKTYKQEYIRLHNSYKALKSTMRAQMIKDIKDELRGLNGRVTTLEEAQRKQVLRNVLKYLGGEL